MIIYAHLFNTLNDITVITLNYPTIINLNAQMIFHNICNNSNMM